MTNGVDPSVARLLGSATRAATLGALANARFPLTAYRVAQMTGAQPIKVIAELRRLQEGGFVEPSTTPGEKRGWILTDQLLRAFLRRRVRIVWSPDWNDQVGVRVGQRGTGRTRIDLSRYPPNRRAVPSPAEFARPSRKDRLLSDAGLAVSRHRAAAR